MYMKHYTLKMTSIAVHIAKDFCVLLVINGIFDTLAAQMWFVLTESYYVLFYIVCFGRIFVISEHYWIWKALSML